MRPPFTRQPDETPEEWMERQGWVEIPSPPRSLEWRVADAGRLAPMLRLPVFPCLEDPSNKAIDKAPACPHGFKDASADPRAIRELWRKHPGPLVGVPTGAATGFDVLDIDPAHGGDVFYEANRAKLPETRVHTTRSGGLHFFFRHLQGLRNSVGKVAAGVDVRADGGYIIWWPLEGFKARGDPTNLPATLAEWPLWILPRFIQLPPPPVYRRSPDSGPPPATAIAGLVRSAATAAEGRRNSILFWAACRMRERMARGDIDGAHGRALLLDAAADAGLPHQEAARTIDGAMRGSP
jgi:Bifunctional DNA primase/polymerase, N-terminal